MTETQDNMHPSEFVKSIDRAFYSDFDPFYFWTLSECVHHAEPKKLLVEDIEAGTTLYSHELLSQLKKSRERYQDYSNYLVRALRYFSSETLVLLVLCGTDFGPLARVASIMRDTKLVNAHKSLVKREIPSGFDVKLDGKNLTFDEWLSYQIFDDTDQLAQISDGEIIDLITEEAHLLAERGAINAFKHGKPTSFGEGVKLAMRDKKGQYTPVNQAVFGINWIEWYEAKNGDFSTSFGTEELNPNQDLKRIMSTSLLMNTICQIRRAKIEGRIDVKIYLPNGFDVGLGVKRQKLKLKFKRRHEGN